MCDATSTASATSTAPSDLLERLATQHARLNAALETTPAHAWRSQYHPDLSPIGWHYAHCHFIESVWLHERIRGAPPARTHDWHDLYFPEWSPKWRRGGRLPPRDELLAWGRDCQHRHREWLASAADIRDHPLLARDYLTGFLAQHHAMHLESLEQVRWFMRLREPTPATESALEPCPLAQDWVMIPGGATAIGSRAITAFDNEQGKHQQELSAFRIAARPVTNGEYLAFMQDGGYRRPDLWEPQAAQWLRHQQIEAPLGWRCNRHGRWVQQRPDRVSSLPPDAPVLGLSWHEAHAFAHWAGARLPHEHEWECAARAGQLHDTGQVWEWCANTLYPYPGFRAFPYAEYSTPWFDGQHRVLRGGCAWSDPLLRRPTLRNFFTPEKRHVFAGLRLARTMEDSAPHSVSGREDRP